MENLIEYARSLKLLCVLSFCVSVVIGDMVEETKGEKVLWNSTARQWGRCYLPMNSNLSGQETLTGYVLPSHFIRDCAFFRRLPKLNCMLFAKP